MVTVTAVAKHPKGKGCWYKITYYVCPVCGGGEVKRKRMWTEPPTDPYGNRVSESLYDGCMDYQFYG